MLLSWFPVLSLNMNVVNVRARASNRKGGPGMIQLNGNDNVAVAIEDCSSNVEVTVKAPAPRAGFSIVPISNIPFGHKIALSDLKPGDIIVKYGRPIGRATKAIPRGELVGVHNIEGLRGRGDLETSRRQAK
jgi:altronate dehydratase